MYCKRCGAYLPDGALVCTSCGAPVSEAGPEGAQQPTAVPAPAAPAGDPFAGAAPAAPAPPQSAQRPAGEPPRREAQLPAPPPIYQQGAYPRAGGSQAPAYSPHSFQPLPPEEPVGTGEWVWSTILSAVPLVGLVMLFIWGFGGNAKASKRNWARAMLIFQALAVALYILVIILVIAGAASPYYY